MASIISKEQERNTKSRGWLIEWFEDHSKGECSSLLLLDGGVSTYLENIAAFSHRSLWSSSLLLRTTPINDSSTVNAGHEAIRACHEAFFQAGSDIVSTVTYQCHYNCCGELLFQRGDVNGEIRAITGNDIDQMLRDGIRLAREARCNVLRDSVTSRDLFVAASVGCYGASLADGSEYRGNYGLSEEQLVSYHRRKVNVLVSEGPDILAFETIPEIIECAAIISLLKEFSAADNCPPAWISLACRDASHLNSGATLTDALDVIHHQDPTAELVSGIGVNCCSCDIAMELARTITRHMISKGYRRFLIFYPNSGELWDGIHATWIAGSGTNRPNEFAKIIKSTIDVVREEWQEGTLKGYVTGPPPGMIIGGCCRTSTDTIAAIRSLCFASTQ